MNSEMWEEILKGKRGLGCMHLNGPMCLLKEVLERPRGWYYLTRKFQRSPWEEGPGRPQWLGGLKWDKVGKFPESSLDSLVPWEEMGVPRP